jgi:hypothetical protein
MTIVIKCDKNQKENEERRKMTQNISTILLDCYIDLFIQRHFDSSVKNSREIYL